MGWIDDYGNGGENKTSGITEGRHTAEITYAVATRSRSGNNMIKVVFKCQGHEFFHYIVAGVCFDENVNKLFSAFDIEPGNFDFYTWVGKFGEVELERDGRFYRVADLVEKEYAPETNTDASSFLDDVPF